MSNTSYWNGNIAINREKEQNSSIILSATKGYLRIRLAFNLSCAIIFFSVLDLITTYLGVSLGIGEFNPIMNYILFTFGFIGISIFSLGLMFYVTRRYYFKYFETQKENYFNFLFFIFVFKSMIVIWNILQIYAYLLQN